MRVKSVLLKTFYSLIILIVVGVAALYFAYNRNLYTGNSAAPGEIYIHSGMLFDAVDGAVIQNPGIVLKDGLISCIGSNCVPSAEAITIDASNRSILPGLIELHGHFFGPSRENSGLSVPAFIWNTAQARPDIRKKLLEAGVTSFRSLGDPRDVILSIRDSIESGELAGPRLFVAGPIFTAPGGHPTRRGQDPNIGGVGGLMTFQSDDADVVRNEVDALAAQGVGGIKAVFHGVTSDSGEVTLPTLSTATLRAIGAKVASNNMWLAVHVGQTSEHVIEAVNAGATSIEHGVRGGNLISPEALDTLVSNDVIYVPTLSREPLGHLNIPALYEADVRIGVGTDTNNSEMSFGESYHSELSQLVDAGLPETEALLAATRNGAIALRKSDYLGTIQEGKLADLILVEGLPWDYIADLQNVEVVVQAGHIVVDKRQ